MQLVSQSAKWNLKYYVTHYYVRDLSVIGGLPLTLTLKVVADMLFVLDSRRNLLLMAMATNINVSLNLSLLSILIPNFGQSINLHGFVAQHQS